MPNSIPVGKPSDAAAALYQTLVKALPATLREALRAVEEVGAALSRPYALVGGLVRDALLERRSEDVDLMVEAVAGGALETDPFLLALLAELGCDVQTHPRFRTAVLELAGGYSLDFAQARAEVYPNPACLPVVSPGGFDEDLKRRDFAVNAMALRVDAGGEVTLLDPFDGQGDLSQRVLRILHSTSFEDAPTRLLRGVRFGGRLGFTFDAQTAQAAHQAIVRRFGDGLSPARLWAELHHILGEPTFPAALRMLGDVGGLSLLGLSPLDDHGWAGLCRLAVAGAVDPGDDAVGAGVLALSLLCPAERRDALLQRWNILGHRARRIAKEVGALGRALQVAEQDGPASLLQAEVDGLSDEATAVLLAFSSEGSGVRVRRALVFRETAPLMDGRSMLAAGVPAGPRLGEMLRRLRRAQVDGEVENQEQALAWVVAEMGIQQ